MECAEPELERSVRRARRMLWGFRMIFYPGAVVIAVVLLGARGEGDPSERFTGRTDQGRPIEFYVDDDRPTYFRTTLVGTCPSGGLWEHTWTFRRLARRGDIYHGRQIDVQSYEDEISGPFTGRSELTLEAHMAEDDQIRGRAWLVQTNRWPGDERRYPCKSGAVDFSARAVD